jgi:hypothetical protein
MDEVRLMNLTVESPRFVTVWASLDVGSLKDSSTASTELIRVFRDRRAC